jgi:hypothetical protein
LCKLHQLSPQGAGEKSEEVEYKMEWDMRMRSVLKRCAMAEGFTKEEA